MNNNLCLFCFIVSLPHGDEFLGGRRVDSDGGVKVCLCETSDDCDAETLDHLIHSQTDEVDTNNLFLLANANELHAVHLYVCECVMYNVESVRDACC